MNNKGQSLILFVLIIPIIAGFLAFFIDLSIVNYEKNRIDGVIVDNLMVIVEKDIRDISKIKQVFLENNLGVDISLDNDIVVISYSGNINSLFGKILHFDFYKLNCKYQGDYIQGKVKKIG